MLSLCNVSLGLAKGKILSGSLFLFHEFVSFTIQTRGKSNKQKQPSTSSI